MSLDPAKPPGTNFDLSHWKLTLPDAREVMPAQLAGGYTAPGVFFTDPRSGGMVMRCPNIAGHTSNSHYARTELRELLAPHLPASDPDNNWTMASGGTLRARLRVDRVSMTGSAAKVGRVVIGQIHAPDTEVIRLYFHMLPDEDAGRIYAGMDDVDNHTTFSDDIVGNRGGGGIHLRAPFSYAIRLHDRALTVRIRRGLVINDFGVEIDRRYAGQPLYFKHGNYNQNDTGDPSDYAQTTTLMLKVSHP